MTSNKKSTELNALISYYSAKSGESRSDIAKLIGMSPSSFYAKLKNVDLFTVGEIRKLANLMSLSNEKVVSVIYS